MYAYLNEEGNWLVIGYRKSHVGPQLQASFTSDIHKASVIPMLPRELQDLKLKAVKAREERKVFIVVDA